MVAPPTDVYYKKRLDYRVHDQLFAFDVAHTLFSTFQIDEGTDLLLRTLALPQPPRTIVDIGCGAGVLGIVLARRFPEAQIISVDRDLLAVRYTRHNAALNAVHNLEVRGSVGLEAVPEEGHDLIVSNIPAKVGDEAIELEFILEPYAKLAPGGSYWFVVVSGLNRLIPRVAVRHNLKLREVKKRAGYTVYQLRVP